MTDNVKTYYMQVYEKCTTCDGSGIYRSEPLTICGCQNGYLKIYIPLAEWAAQILDAAEQIAQRRGLAVSLEDIEIPFTPGSVAGSFGP